MITTLLALAIYTAPCEQFNVCQYQPGYNGALIPTWACNPSTSSCSYWTIP